VKDIKCAKCGAVAIAWVTINDGDSVPLCQKCGFEVQTMTSEGSHVTIEEINTLPITEGGST